MIVYLAHTLNALWLFSGIKLILPATQGISYSLFTIWWWSSCIILGSIKARCVFFPILRRQIQLASLYKGKKISTYEFFKQIFPFSKFVKFFLIVISMKLLLPRLLPSYMLDVIRCSVGFALLIGANFFFYSYYFNAKLDPSK